MAADRWPNILEPHITTRQLLLRCCRLLAPPFETTAAANHPPHLQAAKQQAHRFHYAAEFDPAIFSCEFLYKQFINLRRSDSLSPSSNPTIATSPDRPRP